MTPDDALRILGLPPGVPTGDALKVAFRSAAWTTHPDRPSGDIDRFRDVVAAFELLSRPPVHGGFGAIPMTSSKPLGAPPLEHLAHRLSVVGEITYVDRSTGMVEGVILRRGAALQVLLAGDENGIGRVVDVARLDGREPPPVAEIERLLANTAGPTVGA